MSYSSRCNSFIFDTWSYCSRKRCKYLSPSSRPDLPPPPPPFFVMFSSGFSFKFPPSSLTLFISLASFLMDAAEASAKFLSWPSCFSPKNATSGVTSPLPIDTALLKPFDILSATSPTLASILAAAFLPASEREFFTYSENLLPIFGNALPRSELLNESLMCFENLSAMAEASGTKFSQIVGKLFASPAMKLIVSTAKLRKISHGLESIIPLKRSRNAVFRFITASFSGVMPSVSSLLA